MSESTEITVAEVQQSLLKAIHANVVEAADTDYSESANICAGTARQLAETYRLLGDA